MYSRLLTHQVDAQPSKLKGVCYDVESVMGGNWRPDYNPNIAHVELSIILNELH